MMYKLTESDRHFLWAIFSAVGIILLWRGIWEGIGTLPIVEIPWVSLFIGLSMLTMSGVIFKEFDPSGGVEKSAVKFLHSIHDHPKSGEFTISYFDKISKKEIKIPVSKMRHIERNALNIHGGDKEIFIPIHRVRAVHRKGKEIWRL